MLTLPRGLKGLISFGLNFIYTSLTLPEGYEKIELGEFATEQLHLPRASSASYCDQPKLFVELTGREDDLKISSVKDELVLPEASRSYGHSWSSAVRLPSPDR